MAGRVVHARRSASAMPARPHAPPEASRFERRSPEAAEVAGLLLLVLPRCYEDANPDCVRGRVAITTEIGGFL